MVAVIREKSYLTINDETTKSRKNENPRAKQATLLSWIVLLISDVLLLAVMAA